MTDFKNTTFNKPQEHENFVDHSERMTIDKKGRLYWNGNLLKTYGIQWKTVGAAVVAAILAISAIIATLSQIDSAWKNGCELIKIVRPETDCSFPTQDPPKEDQQKPDVSGNDLLPN